MTHSDLKNSAISKDGAARAEAERLVKEVVCNGDVETWIEEGDVKVINASILDVF